LSKRFPLIGFGKRYRIPHLTFHGSPVILLSGTPVIGGDLFFTNRNIPIFDLWT